MRQNLNLIGGGTKKYVLSDINLPDENFKVGMKTVVTQRDMLDLERGALNPPGMTREASNSMKFTKNESQMKLEKLKVDKVMR